MGKQRDLNLKNNIIYSIFVRNHTRAGNFRSVLADLEKIKALGTDIIWFMPIQPTGELRRKGSLGSPYAIKDYNAIEPSLGTLAEFSELCRAIHEQGMLILLDCVYNHCAPDNVMLREHPDWVIRNEAGEGYCRVGDWSDVADLDFSKTDLREYLIDSLAFWLNYVDGFRCDVANLVPLDFWLEADQTLRTRGKSPLWLAESVELNFVKSLRDRGFKIASDNELYEVFDIGYEYDIQPEKRSWLEQKAPLKHWIQAIADQDGRYPADYIKARHLENHDQPRIAEVVKGRQALENWHAFNYFLDGPVLLFEGTEYGLRHKPSIFDKDPVCLEEIEEKEDMRAFFTRLGKIKHRFPPLQYLDYKVIGERFVRILRGPRPTILANSKGGPGSTASEKCNMLSPADNTRFLGLFDLALSTNPNRPALSDFLYGLEDCRLRSLLDDKCYELRGGQLAGKLETDWPLIFEIEANS